GNGEDHGQGEVAYQYFGPESRSPGELPDLFGGDKEWGKFSRNSGARDGQQRDPAASLWQRRNDYTGEHQRDEKPGPFPHARRVGKRAGAARHGGLAGVY